MVSEGRTCIPLQYCSKKAGAMVSKPIADYAVVPGRTKKHEFSFRCGNPLVRLAICCFANGQSNQEMTPPGKKKTSEPDGTVIPLPSLTIGGGLREKVLAGAAFWSFGTSKPGFRY